MQQGDEASRRQRDGSPAPCHCGAGEGEATVWQMPVWALRGLQKARSLGCNTSTARNQAGQEEVLIRGHYVGRASPHNLRCARASFLGQMGWGRLAE